jgi:predicted amidohydrolase YtcJ
LTGLQADQCLSRKDAFRAITINVAHMWHEENRMGSLETGKLANPELITLCL